MNYLLKNLLITFTITLLLGGVYYFFIFKKPEAEDFSQINMTATAKQHTEKILLDTQRINEFTLDDSIFSDTRFMSLTNTRIPLTDVPSGRENPFDPVY
jgi:hypothetical protein